MDERGDPQEPQSGTADILYLVDRLEELVGMGKRVPLSNRVMVEEEEFLSLVDQLRVAVPNEIKQAQRVIKERERIIGEAQDEARSIVKAAQDRAELLLSQHGVLAEARVRGEEILRRAEEERQRTRGQTELFFMEQIQLVEDAIRRGMAVMAEAAEQSLDEVDRARESIGR